jgi:hypothetical protein
VRALTELIEISGDLETWARHHAVEPRFIQPCRDEVLGNSTKSGYGLPDPGGATVSTPPQAIEC